MEERDRVALTKLLGPAANEMLLEEAVNTIRDLAFREWMDWMSGLYRPTSVSQNNVDRIEKIYGLILGDFPTVGHLVDAFNLPVGRARYIVSILNYGSNISFRRATLNKLIGIIEDSIEGKEDDSKATPFVESGLLNVLDEMEQELLYVDKDPTYNRCLKLEGFRGIGRECAFKVSDAKIMLRKLQDKSSSL